MGKERYKVEEVIEAIRATKGMVTLAADRLGCDPDTVYNYRDRHPSVARVLKAERSRFVDKAELKLQLAVQNGEAWAIAMVLKTLGRERGYAERIDHNINIRTEARRLAEEMGLDADELVAEAERIARGRTS